MLNSLIYNDMPIRDRDEMLSLTDMWRAAGGARHQVPAKWLAHDGTKNFVDYLKSTILGEDSELFKALNEGGEWNTWAHWQIGMAYAKYLSPEFHAWCNEVVRAHMEGRGVPVQAGVPAGAMTMDQVEALATRIITPICGRMDANFART